MNDNYICQKLIIWAELLYGKKSKCYAKSEKIKAGKKKKVTYYIFGSKKLKVENKLTREFALYLVNNKLPGVTTKERYQIKYLDLEINTTRFHSSGAVYDPKEYKTELKLLKKEQKQLKKLGLPKTKANFEKIKVTII